MVSLVPSLTEVLCLVGGKELLVGRNHEDDYPPDIQDRPVLTSQRTTFTTSADVDRQVSESLSSGQALYTLDSALLASLAPHVILTQDLCSVCAIDLAAVHRVVRAMGDPKPSVVSLNPENFEDVIESLHTVSAAIGKQAEGRAAAEALRARVSAALEVAGGLAAATTADLGKSRPEVAFVEWTDPVFVGGHWTPQLIELAGARHSLNPTRESQEGQRKAGPSFKVTSEQLIASKPEILIICPCGLNLKDAGREARAMMEQPWWPQLERSVRKIALVDGNQMFNRPGPRLVDALEWLVAYIHDKPNLLPPDFPFEEIKK